EAARCWGRAGDEQRALLAGARGAEAEGLWMQAGEAWLELSNYDAAVRCFRAALAPARRHEGAGEWSRAAAAYRLAGKPQQSLRCRAHALENGNRLDRAAATWERLGDTPRALDLYARAGRWAEVARLEEVVPEERQLLLPHLRS